MNPEAQRIAIAEACGWSVLRLSCGFYAKHKTEGRISISAASARATQNDAMSDRIPDYLNDLNAMHEAEMSQVDIEEGRFIVLFREYLHTILGHDGSLAIHATAAQRAEAFLRTIQKWEDGA